MKSSIRGWVILLVAMLAICITAIYFIIPKAAAISPPFRWNQIPLDENRVLVHQYFGMPVDTSEASTDKWIATRDNGAYILKIHYTKDSIADSYKLYFDYKLYFIKKEYLLKEQSRQ